MRSKEGEREGEEGVGEYVLKLCELKIPPPEVMVACRPMDLAVSVTGPLAAFDNMAVA